MRTDLLKTAWATLQKKWAIVGIGLLLIGGVMIRNNNGNEYAIMTVKQGDIAHEVVVSGNVIATSFANLAFEVEGKIVEILTDVGQSVKAGDILITLDQSELKAQLQEAQAGVNLALSKLQGFQAALEKEQAELNELKKGTRPEEIQIAQTAVANAERSIDKEQGNLEKAKNEATSALEEVYEKAMTALPPAANDAKTALVHLSELQESYFYSGDEDDNTITNAKNTAILSLFGVSGGGNFSPFAVSKLKGGLYDMVISLSDASDFEMIDKELSDLLDALEDVKTVLYSVPITTDISTADRNTLDSDKSTIDGHISTVSERQKKIQSQMDKNETAIANAEAKLATAENTFLAAQKELDLKKAGATAEEIQAQAAAVKQAQADLKAQNAQIKEAQAQVKAIQAQLDKRVLKAPIDGVVTLQEARLGEIASAKTVLVALISDGNFEIEADVPEVEIAPLKVEDPAQVSLDAYGDETAFNAIITAIDPAETVIDGVSHYQITLVFDVLDDRIRSGMTANIIITTDERKNVLRVHERSLFNRDGKTWVQVLSIQNKKVLLEERVVELGLQGSDGFWEVMNGVARDEQLVLDPSP